MVRLEHANICVRDIDGMVRFLQTAFPEFTIRADKRKPDGARWVHIGTWETYLALNEATKASAHDRELYGGEPGTDHLAFEVDDVEGLRARLSAAGYQDSTLPNHHPHRKRLYFLDPEGNEWEFVEYLSGDPSERNDYELAG